MKNSLFAFILAGIAFSSCQKVMEVFDHVPLPPGVDTNRYITKDTGCNLIAQTGSFINEEPKTQVSGFRKVINTTTGRVDSLITANGGYFEIDSFFYAFEYFSDTVIHVSGVVKTYNRLNDMHLWQFETANELNSDVHLNPSGKVAYTLFGAAVSMQFNYEHGKLMSVDFPFESAPFAKAIFSYDDHGNLTKIVRGDNAINTTLTFEYNLSHSAVSQIYTPVAPYDLYEIMGWIPIAPHNFRTRAKSVQHDANNTVSPDIVVYDIVYSNHVLTDLNALKQFDANVPDINYNVTVVNTLECAISRNGHLPD